MPKALEQKMMSDWAKLAEDGRPTFRDWCRLKTLAVLEVHYGLS
jgi:hypothetical protein